MLIEMDGNVANQFTCCSVDWISKFPDECEVLIARTDGIDESTDNPARLKVIGSTSTNNNVDKKKKKKEKMENENETRSIQHVKLENAKPFPTGIVGVIGNFRLTKKDLDISSLLSLLDLLQNIDISIIEAFANDSFNWTVRYSNLYNKLNCCYCCFLCVFLINGVCWTIC